MQIKEKRFLVARNSSKLSATGSSWGVTKARWPWYKICWAEDDEIPMIWLIVLTGSAPFSLKLEFRGPLAVWSRVGKCIDNAPMESFWGHFKEEWYDLQDYASFGDLKGSIDEFIYFYNHERYQERLNGLSPLEFRTQAA